MIRLVAFDMDGVLTLHPSSWRFVHERLGVDNYDNLYRYRRGELPYGEFLDSDISMWVKIHPDITADEIRTILRDLPVRADLSGAIRSMKEAGARVVIISGGISWLSDIINERVEFDAAYANVIDTDSNGTVLPHGTVVVEPRSKDAILQRVQKKYSISPQETASVGDSFYDAIMFRISSRGIAFNSNSQDLDREADTSITSGKLTDVYRYLFEEA